MKKVSVTSAEWNPSNGGQVIATICDNDGGAVVKSTAKTVVINNVDETAKDEDVKPLIEAAENVEIVNSFKIY